MKLQSSLLAASLARAAMSSPDQRSYCIVLVMSLACLMLDVT